MFEDGRKWLEAYTGIPVLGVIPYVPDLGIDEEDSVALSLERYRNTPANNADLHIGVIQLPYMSNFTDLDPLFLEPSVHTFFCTRPEDLADVDAVILPGTKSTVLDVQWLHQRGVKEAVQKALYEGASVLGICGGYQMLGEVIRDPEHHESDLDAYEGLGLFPSVTTIGSEKQTVLVEGTLLGEFEGIPVEGYEIHMGTTDFHADVISLAKTQSGGSGDWRLEGAVSADGMVIGTYLHGILHNDAFRHAWLNRIRQKKGLPIREHVTNTQARQTHELNRLADLVRAHIDMELVYQLLNV